MNIKFTKPVVLLDVVEEGDTFVCEDFRRYAQVIQFPDPTKVEMTDAVNNFVTAMCNTGKTTPALAYHDLMDGANEYSYDEHGKEYISFPTDLNVVCDRVRLYDDPANIPTNPLPKSRGEWNIRLGHLLWGSLLALLPHSKNEADAISRDIWTDGEVILCPDEDGANVIAGLLDATGFCATTGLNEVDKNADPKPTDGFWYVDIS